MFRVSGKFVNGHTFSISPAPGNDAKEALGYVLGSDEIKNYNSPVAQVTVKQLVGKKKIRISEEPAKPRERKDDKKPVAAASGNSQQARKR